MDKLSGYQLIASAHEAEAATFNRLLQDLVEHLIGVRDYDVAMRIQVIRLEAARASVRVMEDHNK